MAMKVYMVNLGCAKNVVDGEFMLGSMARMGAILCVDPADADVIVVNTCSFIEDAVDESVDTILELARFRQSGVCRRLVVCGCLPQRYGDALADAMPEVDLFFGTGAYDIAAEAVSGLADELPRCTLPDPVRQPLPGKDDDRIYTVNHTVYIKIAEGCDRHCTYCIIPALRGRQRSRPIADIAAEAGRAVASGASEVVLVAQDTTSYGRDLGAGICLADLLKTVSSACGKETWVRVLYMHPEAVDDALLDSIASCGNICRYFDIPIQHSSDRILKRMGRRISAGRMEETFKAIRDAFPEAVLRTTVMVGFPGEQRADFEKLLDFITAVEFDHLGAFIYSDSDDIASHNLDAHVTAKTARRRYDRLMSVQAVISRRKNEARVGKICEVLVEEKAAEDVFVGRAWFQAPEVDGEVCFSGFAGHSVGDRVKVRITGATEYDLEGEAL